ncbi:DUF2785 domain-containing protein [Okeania sp.]|uniref:DUF2785 domain-containing protein n=1 Tax=Okeania sp. TaxID=3100323 RepID=UPI002B4AC588|nr:DUF2785 domain-containing protein [Okeania sp.]MEB3341904.1 DUF2785 domain-containing protein [Okeania sp.]
MDIELLKSIFENKFAVPDNYEVAELTPKLMDNLGATRSDLRDYSYMTLSAWIWGWYDRTYYNHSELLALAEQAKVNIKTGLGETESDGVFLRSYSILLLNDLTEFHRQDPYLEEAEIRDRMELYLTYLEKEQDLRGYISPEKAWSHGIADVADALGILSLSSYLKDLDLMRLLIVIATKLQQPVPSVYLHSEEERLAQATVKICQQNMLSIEQISSWLDILIETERRPSGISIWENFEKYPKNTYKSD